MAVDAKQAEEQFYEWLSFRVSPAQLSAYYQTVMDLKKFFSDRPGWKNILFAENNQKKLNEMLDFMQNDRSVSRMTHIDLMTKVFQLYIEFAEEKMPDVSGEDQTLQKKITQTEVLKQSEPVSVPPRLPKPSAVKTYQVDFVHPGNYLGMQPVKLSANETEIPVHTWQEVYCHILEFMLKAEPERMDKLKGHRTNGGMLLWSDKAESKEMKQPKRILSSDFYAETYFGAGQIVRLIAKLCAFCKMETDCFGIEYAEERDEDDERAAAFAAAAEAAERGKVAAESETAVKARLIREAETKAASVKFAAWLKEIPKVMADKKYLFYCLYIRNIALITDRMPGQKNIYLLKTAEGLDHLRLELEKNSIYIRNNFQADGQYGVVLDLYRKYLEQNQRT